MKHPETLPTATLGNHSEIAALLEPVKKTLASGSITPEFNFDPAAVPPPIVLVHGTTKTFLTPQKKPLQQIGGIPSPSSPALLRPAMACAFLGISRTGLHRLSENDPTFPRKIVLSKRFVGYRAESLAAWLVAKESSL